MYLIYLKGIIYRLQLLICFVNSESKLYLIKTLKLRISIFFWLKGINTN